MPRNHRLAAAAAALVLAAWAPHADAADRWTVDAEASTLGFVGLQGGEAFEGHFSAWTAEIAFDPDDLAASSVAVVIDMASAATGAPQRDDLLPGGDWLAVDEHPQAQFATTGFTHLGGSDYEATADLTIRGLTREVTLPFTLAIDGDRAHVTGALEVLRTDFDVGTGQWASGDMVALEVTITVDLTATRAP